MAKIYGKIEGIEFPEPDYKNYNWELERKKEEDCLNKLKSLLRSQNDDPIIGFEVNVGRGDGYARYIVCDTKPFAMIHLPFGDAWRGDAIWERGINLKDARQMQKQSESRKSLFGRE